jgi:hypothetical protein
MPCAFMYRLMVICLRASCDFDQPPGNQLTCARRSQIAMPISTRVACQRLVMLVYGSWFDPAVIKFDLLYSQTACEPPTSWL